MDLYRLELALKKVWDFGYNWGRKQSNDWDTKTKFIYNTRSFSELLKEINNFNQELKNYAVIRWYNFHSAMGAEYIFSTHDNVKANKNKYDKLIDFTIDDISFDHKTTIFPKGFNNTFEYGKENKEELIRWLYENQSQEQRKHLSNRLFIVLYDGKNKEHWKMKAEISLLKEGINNYMKTFNKNNLVKMDFGEGNIYTDIIWITK